MSLRHAILGILDYQPMHGYSLKNVLELGISAFWPVNLAAIYPNLRQLESEGLVSHQREASAEGRPDRKVYTITEAGREELGRWRPLPPDSFTRVRSPLFLKLFFAQEEDIEKSLEWIEKEIETARAAGGFLRSELDNAQAFSTFFVKFMRESGVAHLELHQKQLEALHERVRKGLEKRKHLTDDAPRGPD
jgi:DNA-binding PadR family transcriptional regulator